MKANDTLQKLDFSPEFIAAAIAAAPEHGVYDPENPPLAPDEGKDAITSYSYAELKAKLAERRHRGPQKAPKKQATAIRFDEDVLSALKATGKGWQTRVNDVMREWVETHA
jgi:uncharacterized protein (DUF4415 family)